MSRFMVHNFMVIPWEYCEIYVHFSVVGSWLTVVVEVHYFRCVLPMNFGLFDYDLVIDYFPLHTFHMKIVANR